MDTHNRRSGKLDKRAQKIAQNIIAEMVERGVLPQPRERQQEEGLLAHDANAGRDPSVEPSRVNESGDLHTLPMQGEDPHNNEVQAAGTADQEENVVHSSGPPRLPQMSGALEVDGIHPTSTLYHDALRNEQELYE